LKYYRQLQLIAIPIHNGADFTNQLMEDKARWVMECHNMLMGDSREKIV